MAINFPGPYELRVGYTETAVPGVSIQHTQRLNVKLLEPAAQGAAFSTYDFTDINGIAANTLDTLAEDYLALFNALFSVNMNVDFVDLWKYPTAQSFDSVFWSTYIPVANIGTSGLTGQSSGQDIYVFRTQEGGTMKLSLMEDVVAPGAPRATASLSAEQVALKDFILDGDGVLYSAPFLARDTSYPFAFTRAFPGRNEGLWKVRNGR